jgi:hypothetical protein
VLDVLAADDYFTRVPLPRRLERPIVRRHDVVERRGLAMRADLRVGMPLVVDQLVLVADGIGPVLEHEVLHAAVAALRDLPFPAEIELLEGLGADDVLPALRVSLAGGGGGQHAVLDTPAGAGRIGFVVASPSIQRLAIEELDPARLAVAVRFRRGLRGERDGGDDQGERADQMPRHVIHLYR